MSELSNSSKYIDSISIQKKSMEDSIVFLKSLEVKLENFESNQGIEHYCSALKENNQNRIEKIAQEFDNLENEYQKDFSKTIENEEIKIKELNELIVSKEKYNKFIEIENSHYQKFSASKCCGILNGFSKK